MAEANAGSERARSFGTVAEEYDRWRPGYPAAAVDWLAPHPPARVAELGAGTGKMTASLVARGLTVEAIEPDPRMLAVLTRNVAGATAHLSDSCSIPVANQTLDAVIVADAWHWFDPEKTIIELRRVLKPGGWLGLVWNVAAEPVDVGEVELLGSASDRYDRDTKSSDAGLQARHWYFADEGFEVERFSWTRELTPDARVSEWATTSMAIGMSAEDRQARMDADRAAFQRSCETAGRSSMPVRSIASCLRWAPNLPR